MSEALLELLEVVDSVKIYIHDGLYTIEANMGNGVFLDHDDLSLEQCIMDVLTTVQEKYNV